MFHLAEAGLVKLVVSSDVLRECEEVVQRKSPLSLPLLAQLLALAGVEASPAFTSRELAAARRYVRYLPDAHILAAAIHACPDWFVTHDREHFLKMSTTSEFSFRIGTPGDLIQALKDEFRV